MRGKYVKGLIAGALIGAAAEMILMPDMDRRTRKKVMRMGRRITDFTGDVWDNIKDMNK